MLAMKEAIANKKNLKLNQPINQKTHTHTKNILPPQKKPTGKKKEAINMSVPYGCFGGVLGASLGLPDDVCKLGTQHHLASSFSLYCHVLLASAGAVLLQVLW